MRILVLIAIGLLLYVIISNLLRKKNVAPPVTAEKMVKCHQCEMHIPKKEALQLDGEFFCSQTHLDDYKSR
jgi:uncharacterized protein